MPDVREKPSRKGHARGFGSFGSARLAAGGAPGGRPDGTAAAGAAHTSDIPITAASASRPLTDRLLP